MEIITNKKPLVSVIIGTYNYGHFIEEAIGSVLNQNFSHKDMDIIVVDDGSTDDTAVRVKKYKDKIRYIFKENGGQASALNVGVENARGEIIAFLDSDDYWHPYKLKITVEGFRKSESVDIVYHDLNIVDSSGNTVGTYFDYIYPRLKDNEENVEPEKVNLKSYLKGVILPFPPTSGIMVKSQCLAKIMPIPEHYYTCTDGYIHHFTLFYAKKFFLIKQPLGYYRVHGNNIFEDGRIFLNGKTGHQKLQNLANMTSILVEDIEKFGENSGYNVINLQKEFKRRLTHYKNKLDGKTFNLLNVRMVVKTHYEILRYQGLKKYFIYSYNYRKNQIFELIRKIRLWSGVVT